MVKRFALPVIREALVDALRISDKQQRPLRHPILTFACAFAILVLVSFGMLYLGDKLNASGMVLTRFMGVGQAAVTARIGYPDDARGNVTVILYDEQFLRASESAWPISYQDHADWLLRLAGSPGARPKAIFLDVTFGQKRDDPTAPALKDALCTVRDTFHVPVFLAAIPDVESGKLAVRADLGSCFTLVGVAYTPDPLDGYAWNYPLTRHLEETGWMPGPPIESSQPSYRTAAHAIAADVAGINLGEESVPMALVWGAVAAPTVPLAERDFGCVPKRPIMRDIIPGAFFQFTAQPPPLCPYHRTLSMEQIGSLSDRQLADTLTGRYIMVGANIPGHNDFARSPVHGTVPGVHYHAMALDNLLTYGEGYKLNHEWNAAGMATLAWPGLLTVLAVLVVRLLWSRGMAGRFDRLRAWADESTRRGRAIWMIGGALLWLIRLTLQFISAAFLIAMMQKFTRAGMLPVAELIGMTLFAEAIGYLARLRWFFLGAEPTLPAAAEIPSHPPPCEGRT